MAPLLRQYFAPKQRSLLSSLFTATFLGALIVVAFPCPAKPGGGPQLEGDRVEGKPEVVVMMNSRRRRFMEER